MRFNLFGTYVFELAEQFDNTTTYLHPVRPIDVNRNPPLSAKFYCIQTRAWGQETMTRLDSKQKVR